MTEYINDAPNAPKAIGPYSQAATAGGFVFLSGQIPLDPASGSLVSGIEKQTNQVMQNLQAVLKAAGLDFKHVLKATIFLTDLNNFQTVNGIYEKWLGGVKPARATIQVSALPKGAEVEIEMVAFRGA